MAEVWMLFWSAEWLIIERKMRRTNLNFNNQYYNREEGSRYSSRSSRGLQSQFRGQQLAKSSNRLHARIDKACTTFFDGDLKKENHLLRKEADKLERELLKRDRVIAELKESNMHNKELEAELIEVYRVLYMYEGKMGEYQKEIKKLEIAIAGQLPKDLTRKVEELLESYRVEASELGGRLGQKEKIILELQAKLKKIETKYFSTAWKLSSIKRQNNNPLKKRFPNLRNTILIDQTPFIEKEKALTLLPKAKQSKPNECLGDYQMADTAEKEQTRFRRVESPAPAEYRASPSKKGVGNIQLVKSFSAGNQEHFSFLNSSNNTTGSPVPPAGIPVPQQNPSIRYSMSSNPPINMLPAGIPPPSNPHIHSQMTISNGGTVRRMGSKELKPESPQAELGIGSQSSGRVELVRTLNEVDSMMNNQQYGAFTNRSRASLTGESIYLK